MAKTYAELSRAIEALKVQAEAARQKEKSGVVERIRQAITAYGLTADELGLAERATGSKTSRVSAETPAGKKQAPGKTAPATPSSAKYRDASGNSWGGRGPKPKWVKAALAEGRSMASLAVGHSPAIDARAAEERAAGPRAKKGAAKGKNKAARKGAKAKPGFKSSPKYRDDAGHAWSGRGPKPAWFTAAIAAGKTLEQLAA